MFKKIGEKFTQMAQDQAEATNHINETVVRLFNEHVEDAQDYVVGVGQIEIESGGAGNAAAKIFLNVAMVESSDYIIGVNNKTQQLVVLAINNDEILDKHILEKGAYQFSKESKAVDEVMGFFGGVGRSLAHNRRDRYDRERFNLKTDELQLRFLIGSYMPEGTNYPYNNAPLVEALKELIKTAK
ncbi:hypothetical protein [Culicoidibacter larvae]|uniref:Uncharacterized protein n=1 Tax=Culicoidibacter larvae TaxID=2579976 RepID=A0A5R8QGH4_9FIRM|nr:hypothetical protein [Culicoidibacter larvae]TLG77105.1 hypothetical protein FEZ08_00370 [Culicoidibacter larvae]